MSALAASDKIERDKMSSELQALKTGMQLQIDNIQMQLESAKASSSEMGEASKRREEEL